jgi:hypothetical protein
MINIDNDFYIFKEDVMFRIYGVLNECIFLFSSMYDVNITFFYPCLNRVTSLTNIYLSAVTWDRIGTFILSRVYSIFFTFKPLST